MRATLLGAASWLDSLAWSLTPGQGEHGTRLACPPNCTPLSVTDVAVLMRMGCHEGRGMFLDPWPALNLHILFPKRAHH